MLAMPVIGPAFTTVSPTTPSEGKKNDRKNEYWLVEESKESNEICGFAKS